MDLRCNVFSKHNYYSYKDLTTIIPHLNSEHFIRILG